MDRKTARLRVTLDGQLVDYWSREAARLDALAAKARFAWQKRGFLRKAERARARRNAAAAGRPRAGSPDTPTELSLG